MCLQADEGTLADIHRRAGDALHAKHDYAGAVAEVPVPKCI